jgi:hypothetical protein
MKRAQVGGGQRDRVVLTGKMRQPKRFQGGQRNSFYERQYYCTDCGHTGWSRHIDLEARAGGDIEVRREHVHGCPECYEKVPCAEECTTVEAFDPKEPDIGGFIVCEQCQAEVSIC